ncbi:MAG: protein kinase domain-containing protein [Blastocatellia bacterium]
MTIAAGTRLGVYEIIAPLGAGGMGEVWRARDERLDREVAIKVLPADFANDADRLKRFEQEARATSALNHPNILTVHDIGNHEGAPYIVAELLDGEELRAQLDNGALPVRKTIEYAQQMAAGLAAAHEKGIVHRDLKPENLFITKDGRVKILDFGLAKLRPPRPVSAGSDVATQKQITNPGTVMGTVGYMSPEQVRGQDLDHRSDLFSFGLILYEMLRGERAFQRETMAETMTAILKDDPPELSETNAKISPQLEKLVRRCLEKQPERRFHSAHDLGFALEAVAAPSGARLETAAALPAVTESLPVGKARLFGNARVAWLAAAVLLLGLLAALPFAIAHLRHAPPAEAVAVRFTIAAPEKVTALRSPEISPDGRNLVFAASAEGRVSLWLRPLGSLTARLLPDTQDVANHHFWSPDSRSICFPAEGKLKKLDLAGGAPQTLCPLPGAQGLPGSGGGAWNREGVILFTSDGRIYRVPATGGEPALVVGTDQPNRDALYRWPVFLPDGRHFLYLRTPNPQGASEIYLSALDGQAPTRLLAADSHALYAAAATGSGHLLFVRAGALVAQPFDASSLKLTGEPFAVADKVSVNNIGKGHFSVSDNGSLAYDPTGASNNQQLTWVDRTGKLLETVGTPGVIEYPRLSPDGKRIAVVRRDAQTGTWDIYVIDLARGASSRLTFDPGDDRSPVWSPDGSRIAWSSNRGAGFQIYQKLASGVGQEELLLKSDVRIGPGNWSADGRFILYTRTDPKTEADLWILPLEGERQPFLFLQTPFIKIWPRFSPDGRWIAYGSNDQGRYEVYVQTFPASGGKWQVSTNGGIQPHWRSDGKELFYISDGKPMAVEVKPGSSFEAGMPKALFDLEPLRATADYAVTADGQRFLFVTQGEATASLQYTVVLNWMAELKK